MPDPSKEQEHRQEAERLARLPKDEQAAVIAWQRDIANNPKLRKDDRESARARADTLDRLLRRGTSGRKNRRPLHGF